MPKPIIAIPTAVIPSTLKEEPPLWAMRSSYARPVIQAGGIPIFLPQFDDLSQISDLLGTISGVLLAGGADVNPDLYGQPHEKSLEQIDHARDKSEFLLVRWAIDHRIPLFGICRGMQMINVVSGGTLHQDIPTDLNLPTQHRQEPNTYANLARHGHLIRIEKESRLYDLVEHEEFWVNSMHHQAVDQLGQGLTVVGRSADSVVEAIEASDPEYWLVGLQSHPEAMTDHNDWTQKIFTDFVETARIRVKSKESSR